MRRGPRPLRGGSARWRGTPKWRCRLAARERVAKAPQPRRVPARHLLRDNGRSGPNRRVPLSGARHHADIPECEGDRGEHHLELHDLPEHRLPLAGGRAALALLPLRRRLEDAHDDERADGPTQTRAPTARLTRKVRCDSSALACASALSREGSGIATRRPDRPRLLWTLDTPSQVVAVSFAPGNVPVSRRRKEGEAPAELLC